MYLDCPPAIHVPKVASNLHFSEWYSINHNSLWPYQGSMHQSTNAKSVKAFSPEFLIRQLQYLWFPATKDQPITQSHHRNKLNRIFHKLLLSLRIYFVASTRRRRRWAPIPAFIKFGFYRTNRPQTSAVASDARRLLGGWCIPKIGSAKQTPQTKAKSTIKRQ